MLFTLIVAIYKLIELIQMVVIVQFVLSLLLAFNVVSMQNKIVSAIWTALNAILDPILNPIRRVMPSTGAVDFSPMIVIFGLDLVRRILEFIAGMAS